jgi:AcrR family transcriptional regulator
MPAAGKLARPVHDDTPAASQDAVVVARWTLNQQAARRRIIDASAALIADEGLAACTFRAVAQRAGLTKSTVHYYFEDANELVDLSVKEIMRRLAAYAGDRVLASADATEAVEFLVRLFMSRDDTPHRLLFRDRMLWPAYTTHAWRRGATSQILGRLETLRAVFRLAFERSSFDPADADERAAAVHNYLLGAMIQNIVEPIERAEVARAVAALSGLDLDPDRC